MGKKVLFTSHVANFQKFNRPFMRMLAEKGYEVHYASMGEEEILDADKAFVVPFTRSPFNLKNIVAYFKLKKIIDREKYDIIHTHTPMGSVVTRLAARKARKNGTRVIYTAHGFHFFDGAPRLNWMIYYPIEKYMAKHTDTLVTINQEDFKRASEEFKAEVVYVPGVGVDLKRFGVYLDLDVRSKRRKKMGFKDSDFLMIYPAELSKRKNQVMLIDAMEKLVQDKKYQNSRLLLLGKDSMNGLHERLIKEKGLEKYIQLLGYRKDVDQLLQIVELSVSSSFQEGLPVHIMEAFLSGIPVISTKCRGATELIEDEKSGFLIDFDDVDTMVEKMKFVHDGGIYGFSMGEIGRQRIQYGGFLLEDVEKKMVGVYER